MTGKATLGDEVPPPILPAAAARLSDVLVSAFLALLVEGDDGGMVAAVRVSVTGHSSDFITRFAT